MSALDIRQAIVNAVAAALPSLRTCEPHGGRFDSVEEIKRYAARGPAVLVAILGLENLERSGGESAADLVLGLFVVTGDRPGISRDTAALALVQALAELVPDYRWGLDAAEGLPSGLRADNLYAAALDKLGVAVWGLSWRQRFTLSALDPATLDAFLTCDIQTQVAAGTPGREDLVTLPQE